MKTNINTDDHEQALSPEQIAEKLKAFVSADGVKITILANPSLVNGKGVDLDIEQVVFPKSGNDFANIFGQELHKCLVIALQKLAPQVAKVAVSKHFGLTGTKDERTEAKRTDADGDVISG